MDEQFDALYAERALLVAVIIRLAQTKGYPVGKWVDPTWPDWLVVGVEVDSGYQWSWHIAPQDRAPFEYLPEWGWDGTTTESKTWSIQHWLRMTEPGDVGIPSIPSESNG